jgi:hypothetical protein
VNQLKEGYLKISIPIFFPSALLVIGTFLPAPLLYSAQSEGLSKSPQLRMTNPHLEFLAIARPGSIRIAGKSDDSKAWVGVLERVGDQIIGKFQFNLDSMDAGISLRTQHMKLKYLETDKFQMAFFEFRIPVSSSIADGKEKPFQGNLTLHSVQHTVSGTFVLTPEGSGDEDQDTIQSHFRLKMSDFKILKPEFMGISVDDEVNVVVSFKAFIPPFMVKK